MADPNEETITKQDALIDFYNRNLQGKAELECQYLKLDEKDEDEVIEVKRSPNPRQGAQEITAGQKKMKVGENLKDTVDFLRVIGEKLENLGVDIPEIDLGIVGKFEEFEAAKKKEQKEKEQEEADGSDIVNPHED